MKEGEIGRKRQRRADGGTEEERGKKIARRR